MRGLPNSVYKAWENKLHECEHKVITPVLEDPRNGRLLPPAEKAYSPPRGTQRPALWKMSSLVICILVICGCGAYLHNRTWPASIHLGDSYPIRTHRNFWGARVHSPVASFSDGVVLRGMGSGRATETCHSHWVRQQWGQDLAEDSWLLVLSS